MRSRVAVVEDEELIRTMLRLNLERAGYAVAEYGDAESLVADLQKKAFDAVLLDIMLPGMSGEECIQILRSRLVCVPVLMLTARKDVDTKVRTLSIGADDYLGKPFDMAEVIARVGALIRRSQGERSLPSHRMVRIGGFAVDLDSRSAQTTRGLVKLSDREVALLELFQRNRGKTLTRNEILEEVWGLDADPTPRTVDNYVVRLRRLFEKDSARPRHFVTVRSAGYRFDS